MDFKTLIGDDCYNIIESYRIEMETLEKNIKTINECINRNLDYEILESLFDNDNYGRMYNMMFDKYYLKNFTIKNLQNYFNEENIMDYNVILRFTVNSKEYLCRAEDFIKINIKKLKNNYLINQKIEYIYKNRNDTLCVYLGVYEEERLTKFYDSIGQTYTHDSYIFFN